MAVDESKAYGVEVLAFAAHPDDIELCCGGLLASMADRGHRVGVIDLTRGELASAGTPESRRAEAQAAAEILGLAFRENLELPDAWLNPWSGYDAEPEDRETQSHIAKAVAAIRRHRPELVVIPWTVERHPDHEAAGWLLRKALFFCGVRKYRVGTDDAAFRPRQVLEYPMRYVAEPQLLVDTSGYFDTKRRAIEAYASQLAGPADTGRGSTLVSSPDTLEVFEARDRLSGAMLGVRYAEPYMVSQTLGVRDPVAHFRAESFGPAHFFAARVR